MATIPTVTQAWEEFRRQVIPADAGPNQLASMRMAFFAGYFQLLTDTHAISELGDDAACLALQMRHDECLTLFTAEKARH